MVKESVVDLTEENLTESNKAALEQKRLEKLRKLEELKRKQEEELKKLLDELDDWVVLYLFSQVILVRIDSWWWSLANLIC